MSISQPSVARSGDWDSWIPADLRGPCSTPPPEAGRDDWERWEAVRMAVRSNTERHLPVDQVRRLQRRLRPDGLMTSTCGEFDPLTVLAVMWYQQREDLPVTGVLDEDTLGALAREWPDLRRCSSRRLLPPRVLVPSDCPPVERFLYYQRSIRAQGGLFDDGHREVNVLVLRGAELTAGAEGPQVRSSGPRPATSSAVTVSLWLERAGGDDGGAVVGVGLRERPGMVVPVPLRTGQPITELGGGQYVCDIECDEPPLDWCQAVVPDGASDRSSIPPHIPRLPPVAGVRRPARLQTDRMTYPMFFAELVAMRRERMRRDGWHGVRVLTVDASRLDPV